MQDREDVRLVMCYQSDGDDMSLLVKAWNWVIIALSLFIITGCGPTIRNSTVTINNESGTVNVGNKDVAVPIKAAVPVSPQ